MASWTSACVLSTALVVALLVLSSSAQPDDRYEKESEEGPMVPRESRGSKQLFYSGSRYGRGGNSRRDGLHVVPRTDRFYMGSRYGKRASNMETPVEISKVLTSSDEQSKVTCLYTGVTNLYRCFDRKDNASDETTAQNI